MLQIKLFSAKKRDVKYCNTANNHQIGDYFTRDLCHRFGHRDIAFFWLIMQSPKKKNHRKH